MINTIPKYRYVKVRTGHFSQSDFSDPILFAIDNNVILFSNDIEKTLNGFFDDDEMTSFIYESALRMAEANNEELYEKTITFDTLQDYEVFMDDTNGADDADAILNLADYLDYCQPYRSHTTGSTMDEGIGYDGRYELPSEDEIELIKYQNNIPTGAIQDQINYLRNLDEIVAFMAITKEDIAEAIAAEGYTDSQKNIEIAIDEIHEMIGTKDRDKAKDFFLESAINRSMIYHNLD
jgi:hypothetical protein